jgi:Reverse transcriptase (RNA-dependent DNA polymerase)
MRNKTWRLVPMPRGHKVISTKWIFHLKVNELGEINRCKARLVVGGFE